MEKELKKISKYLSFILRHQPQAIDLKLDKNGWASVEDLISKTTEFNLDRSIMEVVVETNDKQRFSLNEDESLIRANQGHSLDIDLSLQSQIPPATLFHGTADRFLEDIRSSGLDKMKRHHVHLTESKAVAKSVGSRYGKPVLLKIDTEKMLKSGFSFYQSANKVWLVDHVPFAFISIVE